MRTRISLLLVAVGSVLTLAGCSDSSAPRAVLQVASINDNAALSSDVYNLGDDQVPSADDFVVEDAVRVQIWSDPHDDAVDLNASGPFGYVVLDRYEVRFESTEEIPGFTAGLGWTVPFNQFAEGSLTIVPYGTKLDPPLVSLIQGGELRATAHITFIGHEVTSNAPVKFTAVLPVHFANWVDPS